MGFYDLNKDERTALLTQMRNEIMQGFMDETPGKPELYFSDEDTYIRKSAYLITGKLYFTHASLRINIIRALDCLMHSPDFRVRQSVINSAGEIGKYNFPIVKHFFDKGLFDAHHSPRNAVIGSLKKMAEVNPEQVLPWARQYLHHPEKEIRREICHGIELRGRKFPQDILPLLEELQYDQTARVRNTLVHVLGQIAYKKSCLQIVVAHLNNWKNKKLVDDAMTEIIDVHHRYRKFAALSREEASLYIEQNYRPLE